MFTADNGLKWVHMKDLPPNDPDGPKRVIHQSKTIMVYGSPYRIAPQFEAATGGPCWITERPPYPSEWEWENLPHVYGTMTDAYIPGSDSGRTTTPTYDEWMYGVKRPTP